MLFQENDASTPIFKWFESCGYNVSYPNGRYANYDYLPQLFTLLEDYLKKETYKYNISGVLATVIGYVNNVVKNNQLENDMYLVEEFYDKCLDFRKIPHYGHRASLLDSLLYLDEFPQGKEILKKNGIDFSKHNKYREAAYEKFLHTRPIKVEKLQQYRPKEIDSKKLLEKYLSIEICEFLTNNDIDVPQKHLYSLLHRIYSSYSFEYQIRPLYDPKNEVDRFTNMLVKNANFRDYIASRNSLDSGIYNYFNRDFPIPQDLELTEEEKFTTVGNKKLFINEFSRKLYRNPEYKFINLNTKFIQKVNLKHSGTKFVTLEEQEENLKREKEREIAEKGVVKRLKV